MYASLDVNEILIEFEMELMEFHKHSKTKRLTDGAKKLMYALLLLRCKAEWEENFQADNLALCSLSGLSQAELENKRFELQAHGFICFLVNGEETAIYQIYSLLN